MGVFYLNYALLVVNSFGLQNALEKSRVDIGHFFARCHAAATACATVVRDEMGPSGKLRYCTDSIFVQCSYAILSLLKAIFAYLLSCYTSANFQISSSFVPNSRPS